MLQSLEVIYRAQNINTKNMGTISQIINNLTNKQEEKKGFKIYV